jgi:phage virion morphogenesis protein
MSGTALVFDFSGLSRLEERISRLSRLDKSGLLDALGAEIESQTKLRIESEKESPAGEAWPGWSARYAKSREGQHSLLMGEGHLYETITRVVHGDSVEVGTNRIYGAVHQFGFDERNIPARAYLGISSENEEDLEDTADRFLDRILGL